MNCTVLVAFVCWETLEKRHIPCSLSIGRGQREENHQLRCEVPENNWSTTILVINFLPMKSKKQFPATRCVIGIFKRSVLFSDTFSIELEFDRPSRRKQIAGIYCHAISIRMTVMANSRFLHRLRSGMHVLHDQSGVAIWLQGVPFISCIWSTNEEHATLCLFHSSGWIFGACTSSCHVSCISLLSFILVDNYYHTT
jgi:hypothetical protein